MSILLDPNNISEYYRNVPNYNLYLVQKAIAESSDPTGELAAYKAWVAARSAAARTPQSS